MILIEKYEINDWYTMSELVKKSILAIHLMRSEIK
jgi:hypothetical protein